MYLYGFCAILVENDLATFRQPSDLKNNKTNLVAIVYLRKNFT